MNTKNTLPLIPADTCPRCGISFTCQKGRFCWCVEIHLNANALAFLEEHYTTCLCKDCLKELSAAEDLAQFPIHK